LIPSLYGHPSAFMFGLSALEVRALCRYRNQRFGGRKVKGSLMQDGTMKWLFATVLMLVLGTLVSFVLEAARAPKEDHIVPAFVNATGAETAVIIASAHGAEQHDDRHGPSHSPRGGEADQERAV
jgi:hypothetical protein